MNQFNKEKNVAIKKYLDFSGLKNFLDNLRAERPVIELTSAEYAATQSLQEELTAALPGITQMAVQEGNMIGMEEAVAQQQQEQTQPQPQATATSDVNEKTDIDSSDEAARELLMLGKKYYKSRKS